MFINLMLSDVTQVHPVRQTVKQPDINMSTIPNGQYNYINNTGC